MSSKAAIAMEAEVTSSNPLSMLVPDEIPFDVPYGLPISLDRAGGGDSRGHGGGQKAELEDEPGSSRFRR